MKKEQKIVDQWIKQYGVRYFDVLTNLGQLTEEVGELSRILIRTHGEQTWKKKEQPHDINKSIAEEMSDIIFVVICLANQMKIDLDEAFELKMKKKTKRDKQRHTNNIKLKK